MKCAILWILLAAVAGLGIGSINVPLFVRLVEHGVRAQAVTVELTPEFHNTVRYVYQVGGKKFEDQKTPWPPNPSTGQIGVGQALVICYDPHDPSDSVLGDPKPMLNNELISVGMAAVGFPTVIVFGQSWYRRKRERLKDRR